MRRHTRQEHGSTRQSGSVRVITIHRACGGAVSIVNRKQMNFDTYWKGLVKRVYREGYRPEGAEGDLYRLTCIHGETVGDGIEAYFERRHEEFEADMDALARYGFHDIAADYREAKKIMFGDAELTYKLADSVNRRLMNNEETDKPILTELRKIYKRVCEKLPKVLEARDKIGVENRFFEGEA